MREMVVGFMGVALFGKTIETPIATKCEFMCSTPYF